MKKNAIILTLCIGLLSGVTAEAYDAKITPGTQTVVFSDSISPKTHGICFVVKKDQSIDDNANVYAVKNAFSNENGEIEFSVVMPEEKNDALSDGEYDIYIKERDGAVKKSSDPFWYASLDTRNQFFAAVRDVKNVDELTEILAKDTNRTVLKAIGCETGNYHAKTAQIMYDAIENINVVDQAEFVKEYNRASGVAGFENPARDKNDTDALLRLIKPEFDGIGYDKINDKNLTDWLSSYFTNHSYSVPEYKIANILYLFNTCVSDQIDDLFAKHDGDLGITGNQYYITYSGLDRKATTNDKIAEALAKKPASSVDDLLDAVKTAVSAGNRGTSGSSGGSASSGVAPFVSGVPADAQTTMGTSPAFGDLNQAEWARTAVVELAKAGIVAGDENGNFRPNDYISREEYVKMLVLAANKYNENATCDFGDVSQDAWYYSYVASANEYGIAHGISDTEFGVGKALTRQDMAVLSLRAKGSVSEIRNAITFADHGEIADYAKDAVSKLYMSGAVNGMGNNLFAPLGQATRAECAQIVFNLFLK